MGRQLSLGVCGDSGVVEKWCMEKQLMRLGDWKSRYRLWMKWTRYRGRVSVRYQEFVRGVLRL